MGREGAIVALAAVVVATPAIAQTVTVYGRLYPEIVWTRMTGSTQPGSEVSTIAQPPTGETFGNIVRKDSSNSRLGFRGEEPLGAGLKAFFQIEQRIQVDTGGSQLASRDTFVGLASDRFGTVKMGGFDTPILHGLCSYGVVCKAVVDAALGGDVTRVARYQARFSGVVFPGETLVTSMWKDGGRILVSAASKERGKPVISNAAVTLRS